MRKPNVGETYLYHDSLGDLYHVKVVKRGLIWSLCMWGVEDVDFGRTYDRAGWKLNRRMFKDV